MGEGEKINKRSAFVSAVIAVWVFFALPVAASAATLYLSPASGTYSVGKTFNVGVYVSSPDQPINAYNGTLSFTKDNLEVVSLSKAGSITSLWVQEPSFSNSAGTFNYEGVVLSPGFTGTGGQVLMVTLRAKAAGTGTVSFVSGSVLANDGMGTNVTSGLGRASFSLTDGATPTTPTAPAPSGVPGAPAVSSSTHPDPAKWYQNNNPTFSWKLPAGTTGVNVLADHNPSSDPGTSSDGVFSTYTYDNVDEGTWYFHVKTRNDIGWGPTTHFRFQIDRTAPTVPVASLNKDAGLEAPEISIRSSDALSGVAAYSLSVDGGEAVTVSATEFADGASYPLPATESGLHTVTVRAVDGAGNVSETASLSYMVELPQEPSIVDVQPSVAETPAFRFGELTLNDGSAFILLLLIILILLFIIWKQRHGHVYDLVKQRRELDRIEKMLHSAFDILRGDMRKELKLLDKTRSIRALTKEEEKIAKRLQKDIDLAETMIGREVEDLKKIMK